MARYIRDLQINQPEDFVQYIMQDFLSKNGFKQKQKKGEWIWQEGTGTLTPARFFKYFYQNGGVHIEAWTRTAILPGVFFGENAMTGFVGIIPKKAYQGSIEDMIALLYQPLPSNNQNMNQMSMENANYGQTMPNGPILVQGVDNARYAVLGLGFAIAGIFGFFSPLAGILFGVLGISFGKKSKGSSKDGEATAAIVIGIITTIISVVILIFQVVVVSFLANV